MSYLKEKKNKFNTKFKLIPYMFSTILNIINIFMMELLWLV